MPACAHDALGRPLGASIARLPGGEAVVEATAASGLALLDPAELDAEGASSAGTGELIIAAVAAGAGSITVALGGAATTDGGAGALAAIERGGGLRGARLRAACDVRTPFERAAAVYAPQKGASPEQVLRLGERLRTIAAALPRDPTGVPCTGAGGGLAGGLWSALGAELLCSGAAYVLDALDFDGLLANADAVLVGEGRLDGQSLEGKAAAVVLERRVRAASPSTRSLAP